MLKGLIKFNNDGFISTLSIGRLKVVAHRPRRWDRHLGILVGMTCGFPQIDLRLIWIDVCLMLWSHPDDCECDWCMPF